jgi:hypothetical protein
MVQNQLGGCLDDQKLYFSLYLTKKMYIGMATGRVRAGGAPAHPNSKLKPDPTLNYLLSSVNPQLAPNLDGDPKPYWTRQTHSTKIFSIKR